MKVAILTVSIVAIVFGAYMAFLGTWHRGYRAGWCESRGYAMAYDGGFVSERPVTCITSPEVVEAVP